LCAFPLLQKKIIQDGYGEIEFDSQPPYASQERTLRNVCRPSPQLRLHLRRFNTRVSTQKNPDDVVITLAIRTPLTKGFKGGFKDTPLDFMVYSLLKEVIKKSRIDPQMVEDICLGNVCLTYHFPA